MTAGTETTSIGVTRTQIDWTPYLAGAGIGVLSWAAFAIADDDGMRPQVSVQRFVD